MKISKFCWGVELSDAARFLAKYGMVLSGLWFTGGVIMLVLPLVVFVPRDSNKIVGLSFIILLINIGWFIFSYLLNKRIKSNDLTGVKKMMRIGSTLIGLFQSMVASVGLLSGIYLLVIRCTEFLTFCKYFSNTNVKIFPIIIISVGGLWIIVSYLLLHGNRKRSPGSIKLWILFDFVLSALFLLIGFVVSLFNGVFIPTILLLIAFFLTYMYNSSMVIVHYNIVLEEHQVLENFSHENPRKIDMTEEMMDQPPPYSLVI